MHTPIKAIGLFGCLLGIVFFIPPTDAANSHFDFGKQGAKHRLIADLLCEESTSTSLSVASLHSRKTNRMTIIWTDSQGNQVSQTKLVEPHEPLVLNCDSIPQELSPGFPCLLFLDSTQPTAALLTRVVTGSPIQSTDTAVLASTPLF